MLQKLVILYFINSIYSAEISEECSYVDYLDKKFNLNEIGCPSNTICNSKRVVNVRYIETPRYFYREMKDDEDKSNTQIQKPVHQLLRRCCGTCANINQLKVLNNIGELTQAAMNVSDLIFPVLSTASKEKMYGFYFVPLVDIPPMMYLTEAKKVHLLDLLPEVVPICFVSILLCLLAGFFCWLLETWKNKEEFPRSFLIGWYEGFWWAFVSMTTVGYGDKVPKSFLGRIFSMAWITIGMIAYGLLTGIVYTEVVKVNAPPQGDMSGKNVGSLLFRDYDAMMISESGGNSIRNEDQLSLTHSYYDFLKLVDRLEKKSIDGIAVDSFTKIYLFWTNELLKKGELDKLYRLWFDNATIQWFKDRAKFTEKLISVNTVRAHLDPYTYGILVKHRNDYLYFKSAADDLRKAIRRQWFEGKQRMLTVDRSLLYAAKNELYSYSGTYFQNTLIAIAIMVLLICSFGAVYELIRRDRGKVKDWLKCMSY